MPALASLFFDTALQQAALICNVVPVRGAFRPGTDIPAVPFMLHYKAEARISRIRVWGCPVVAKAYLRRYATGRILQDHNLVQRGVRGTYAPLTKLGTSFGSPRPDNLPSVPMYPSTKNFPPLWRTMVAYITILFPSVRLPMPPWIFSVL
jgi:hypothetical protein